MKLSRIILSLVGTGLLWACANIGNPEGGPFDMTPPRLVGAKPGLNATRVTPERIELEFDEYVKLNNPNTILISPLQQQEPIIRSTGKGISVRFVDSLLPNTTYSIYFGDAIVDNNEDNPIEGFGYTFSTGDQIDTMQLGGIVLDAETLEPVSDLLIGSYWAKDLQDSVVIKDAFRLGSKTTKQGRFTVRGLRDSVYRVFALKDDDGNFRYSGASEGFAFDRREYKTTKIDSVKTDTIRIDSIVRRDTLYRDSLVTYNHTYYSPSDIILRYFKAKTQQRGLERSGREDSLRFSLEFAEELKVAPTLRSLDKPTADPKDLYLATLKGQTATYWLKDKALIGADSIRWVVSYQKTDSLMKLYEKTDTLSFPKPRPRAVAKKPSKDKKPENPFKLSLSGATGILSSTKGDSLILSTNMPIEGLHPEQIKIEVSADSVYKPQPFTLTTDTEDDLRYLLNFERAYGHKYRVRIDSGGIRSIYGHLSDSLGLEQKVEAEAEFGALALTVDGLERSAKCYVELLDKSGLPIAKRLLGLPKASVDTTKMTDSISNSQSTAKPLVEFIDLKPDTYYIRLYVDDNGDDVWTTGEYPTRQPEEMYYSPMKYEVKKSFTTSETWRPLDTPLDKQKPTELLKNKGEIAEKRKREDKNKEYYERMESKKRKKQ